MIIALAPRAALAIGENTGRIGGSVLVDPTNEGLAGVTLTVRSKSLIGGAQTVTTQDDGSYMFQNLPPGSYELTANIEGFTPIKQKGIVVNAGALTPIDVHLSLQTEQKPEEYKIIEKVNPTLNPESAAAVTTLGNQQIVRAPQFRQEKGVAQFAPGVTIGTDKASVRGGLGRYNRYFIDGLEVTDITTGAFGTSSALINVDSVEQFVISVGAMDAEFNSLGLVQNMVTRSGGNRFTIDMTLILQPHFFAATTRYPAQGQLQNQALLYDDRPMPERAFYMASLNLGGPIVKDKLWFWTTFQFNFNRLTNNIQEVPFYGIREPYDRYQDQTLYLGRAKLTWQATQSTRLSLSFSTDQNFIRNASTSSAISGVNPSNLAPEAERRVERAGYWLGLLLDSSLTPKLLFQLQTGFSYKNYLEDTALLRNGVRDRVTPSHVLATADQYNNFVYLNGNRPWDDQGKWNLQFAPTLLYTTQGLGGTHNVKAGMQISYMRFDRNVGVAGGMRFTDTVPGLPCDPGNALTFSSCSQVEVFPESQPVGGQAGPGYSTRAQAVNLGLFIQDRYTIMRWLTIVPGFRIDAGWLYDTNGTKVATLLGYGPRLSLVYDLLHDRTTLIQAHYGRHNDVGNAGIADQANPQQLSILQRWNPSTQMFEEVRKSGGPGGQIFDSNVTPPKLDEVSVGVKREVVPQAVAGVDYTFRRYSNMWINEEVNQIWDPAGTRVVGHVNGERQRIFKATTPDAARRDYHGLDLWVRGTPGNWDITASYTLALVDGTVNEYFEPGGFGFNPRLSGQFYGPLAGQYKHYLKALVDYTFRFGLTLGARFQYLAGSPLWKAFRSPEDQSFTLYRSPRGSTTGTNNNDPKTWSDFRLPDQLILDLQVSFSLEPLTRQRIDIIAMVFNALNIATPFALDQRDGPAFGVVTRRAENMFAEIVLRYRY